MAFNKQLNRSSDATTRKAECSPDFVTAPSDHSFTHYTRNVQHRHTPCIQLENKHLLNAVLTAQPNTAS